ncbi:MAG: hypothetical protein R2911_35020 [Caldilineaceae bacterium]
MLSHGGSTGATTDAFNRKLILISRCIAVVDVNYGGSTGFGRAYRQLAERAVGHCGRGRLRQCRPLFGGRRQDGNRLAIAGSAGGYTT